MAARRRRREAASAREWRETSARLRRQPDVEVPSEATEARGPLELEAGISPRGKLIGIVVFAALWNGIVSLFLFFVILPSFQSGDPEWLVSIFMVPFVLIGLATIAGVVYQFLAQFNPRPRLTLADGRLTPGSEVELSPGGSAARPGASGASPSSSKVRSPPATAAARTPTPTATCSTPRKSSLSPGSACLERNIAGPSIAARSPCASPEPTMPSFDAGNKQDRVGASRCAATCPSGPT